MNRLAFVLLLLGLFTTGAVAQQVPDVLHYQASLLEDDQQVEGEVAFAARIFDAETGGQALWSEARPAVPVTEGRMSLLLGGETPFPADLFDGGLRYLEIEINGERLPRLRMASTAYALRAGVAAAVSAGAVTTEGLAPDAAVASINDVAGALTVTGANGATVNVDPDTKVITISAPGGDGTSSGILGIQNTDGALQVVDPNGPTTTVNVQPGGIGPAQLADGGVGTDDLADGSVTARKLADQSVTTAKLAPDAAVTALNAGTGLESIGTTGAVTLGVAAGGITAAELAENAVNRQGLAPGVVVDELNGLVGTLDLTSSNRSIGITPDGAAIDLLLNPAAAVTGLSVETTTLTGPVALAAADGASLSVDGDTITISAKGTGGTITGVTAGTGLTGGGTTGAVTVGVANGGIGTAQLAGGSVTGAKVAPDAITSAMIVNGTVATADLAPNAAVTSVNEIRGDLRFEADGGATINVDRAAGTITLSAPQADGTGILGVQNTDGALLITNPSGPTATINLQDEGIGTDQLADDGVTAAKLAARAVRAPALDATNFAGTGQVLSYAGNDRFTWVTPADGDVTGVTAGGGLTGGGTSGTVSLAIAENGVTRARLADGAVNTAKLATDAVTGAQIAGQAVGTAALANGAVTAAKLATGANPATGQVLGFDGSGLDWVTTSMGDITAVTAQGGLSGGGTGGDVSLSVANEGITDAKLATGAVTGRAIANGTVGKADLASTAAVTSLATGTDALTGDVALRGSSNISVSRVTGENAFQFSFTGELSESVTSVAGVNGLATVAGPTGEVELGIANGGVTGGRLANGAISGGANVQVTRDGDDNFVVSAPSALTSAVTSIGADGETLAGNVQFATSGSASLDVSGNTITFDAASGGLSSVATDGTLDGDGTSGSPLGIAAGQVAGDRLATGAVTGGTNVEVTRDASDNFVVSAPNVLTSAVESIDAGGSTLSGPLTFATSGSASLSVDNSTNTITFDAASGGLSNVATNGTLNGDGTGGSPLGVANGAITTARLAANAVTSAIVADNSLTAADLGAGSVGSSEIADGSVLAADLNPNAAVLSLSDGTDVLTGGVVLQGGSNIGVSRISGQNAFEIAFEGDVNGGLTSVSSDATLTGDGTSGSPLGIGVGEVAGDRLADGALTGGANVQVTRDGDDNFVVSAPSALTSAVETIEAGGSTLSGPLEFATSGSASLSVDNSTNTITFDAASGGLSSVATDGTLDGDGTSGNELRVADGQITTAKLAENAVTSAIVASNSLTAADLAAGSVGTSELSTSSSPSTSGQVLSYDGSGLAWASPSASVTTDGTTLTGDGSGTPLSIRDGGVGSTQLAGDAVETAALADGAVTTAKLAENAVTSAIVASNSLTAADLAAGSVGTSELSTSSSPSTSGQVLSYDGSGLAWVAPSATVTADGSTLIGDGSSGSPLSIRDGGVGSTQLAGGAVGTTELDGGAVTGDKLAADAVTADKIATGAVGSDALAPDAVTAAAVAPGAIGTSELADASVVAADVNVAGTPAAGDVLAYDDTQAGDLIWQTPGSATSSLRFKTDVETIADARSLVERLRGVRYQWTADGRADVGLIAEEVAQVLPELVTYEADGTTVRGLRYGPLVGVLVEAAKAQQDEIDSARETIAGQQDEIDALSARLARLEALVQSMPRPTPTSTP